MRTLCCEKSCIHSYSPLILRYFLTKPRPGPRSRVNPPPMQWPWLFSQFCFILFRFRFCLLQSRRLSSKWNFRPHLFIKQDYQDRSVHSRDVPATDIHLKPTSAGSDGKGRVLFSVLRANKLKITTFQTKQKTNNKWCFFGKKNITVQYKQ